MKLISISDHNDRIRHLLESKYLTGVECPHCGNELQYTDNTILLSYPGQRNVKCFKCEWNSSIYV